MTNLMTSHTQWENTFGSMTNHRGGSPDDAENTLTFNHRNSTDTFDSF